MRTPSLLMFLIACGGRGCGDGCGPDDTGHTGDPCADEDKSTWFADNDDDGHGDAAAPVEACDQPSGAVASSDDCDDGDGAVWEEGEVYLDGDGDGFGAGATVEQCGLPTGYAAVDGDCDDEAAAVYPDAEVTCGNGIDDDCDGLGDCADPTEASQEDLVLARISGEDGGFGATVTIPGDLDGDGLVDLSVGAPEADGAGAAYLFGSPVANQTSTSDAVAAAVGASADILAGTGITFGDLDDDADLDWVISAPEGHYLDGGATIYVLHGPQVGTVTLAEGAGVSVLQAAAGWSMDAGSDIQGSDADDLLFTNPGGVLLLPGPFEEGTEFAEDLKYGSFSSTSSDDGQRVMVAGDVTGDGQPDVFIGAPEDGSGVDAGDTRDDAGNAYLIDEVSDFRDGDDSGGAATYARVRILGERSGSRLGASLSPAGDIDQDGYADVLVGAPEWSPSSGTTAKGAAYLYSGADLTALDEGDVLFAEDGEAQFYGEEDDQQLGYGLAGGADLDGDGAPDIVVGVPGYDGDQGLTLVWFGPVRGDQDMDEADLTLTGEAAGDRFGQAVDAGGDFNGLGWDDLVVGAPGAGGGDGEVTVFAFDRL